MFYNGYDNQPRQFYIPPVTKHLLIINVLLFLAGILVPKIGDVMQQHLALYYWGGSNFNPAQLVTYMFMHGGIMHIFFNMFALLMFGKLLELVWGPKRFLLFYMVCGVGAGIVHELVATIGVANVQDLLSPEEIELVKENGIRLFRQGLLYQDPDMATYEILLSIPTVGASGAIFGILMGIAFLFPNMPIYIWFIPIPIKTKWMVLGYAVLELWLGASGAGDGVAHFAHLGGLLFGIIVMYVWYGPGLFKGGARRM